MFPLFRLMLPLIFLLGLIAVIQYNRLIRLRNKVEKAWSEIEVQIQRRMDILSSLMGLLDKRSASAGALSSLQSDREFLRQAENRTEEIEAGRKLAQSVLTLYRDAPAGDDLFANTSIRDLTSQLSVAEEQIQLARRYYNGSVKEFNDAVDTFPGNLFAPLFGLQGYDYFESDTYHENI
jgi:LemA protein